MSFICKNGRIEANYQLVSKKRGLYFMGKPKKRTSHRRTGTRRSHLVVKLARAVNAKSPVKAYTTRRESGAKKA